MTLHTDQSIEDLTKAPLQDQSFEGGLHRFWWLDRSLDIGYSILRVEEPLVVTVLKGRPKGTGPFGNEEATRAPPSTAPAAMETPRPLQPSIRRDRSAWETSDVDKIVKNAIKNAGQERGLYWPEAPIFGLNDTETSTRSCIEVALELGDSNNSTL